MTDNNLHYEFSVVDFSSICLGSEDFLFERFGGAVTTKIELENNYQTEISLDGLAFFMKRLLSLVFSAHALKFTMKNMDSDLIMAIEWKGEKKIDRESKMRLCDIARLSGFYVDFTGDCELKLTFPSSRLNLFSLYAASRELVKESYRRAF